MKRTERLFAIAEHLRTRRTGVTAESLAERFGVSLRTIYRDLDSLREAHLPLNAEPGPGGGYALDRAYQMPPVHLSAREAALLVATATWIERSRLLPFLDTFDDAIAKVKAALPPTQRVRAERLAASVSFVGVPSLPVDSEVRRTVERAWIDDVPIAFTYDGARGPSRRRAEIRSVVMDRWHTLLNATDLDRMVPRQFRLDRMSDVELLPR